MLIQLNTLILAYTQLMSMVGSVQSEQTYSDQIPILFAECITKIENGKVILLGHEELLQQLRSARTYAFPWKIEVLDLIVDHEKRVGAVRFTWNSEKVGLHITTAILKFDEDDKIFEINEVYNKFADITH